MVAPNLESRFVDFWARAQFKGDPLPVYRSWAAEYSDSRRAYHTLKHIREGLDELSDPDVLAECDNPLLVEAAWWPHDLVYKAGKNVDANEAESAARALLVYSNAGLPDRLAYGKLLMLIIATRHSTEVDPTNKDARVIRDIDLSVLGTRRERYAEYAQGIRKEWVDAGIVNAEEFMAGRPKFLREFLDERKGQIYNTPLFRRRLERQARMNIDWEIGVLTSGQLI